MKQVQALQINFRMVEFNKDLVYLLPALTGLTVGNEYIITVNVVQHSRTTLEKSPNLPSQNGPCTILSRPLARRQIAGRA